MAFCGLYVGILTSPEYLLILPNSSGKKLRVQCVGLCRAPTSIST